MPRGRLGRSHTFPPPEVIYIFAEARNTIVLLNQPVGTDLIHPLI
jgi:hypothetical protein